MYYEVFGIGMLAGLMVAGFLTVWLFVRRAVSETDAQEQAYQSGIENVLLKQDVREAVESRARVERELQDWKDTAREAEHDVSNLLAQNELQAALYRVRLQKAVDDRERIAYDRDELRELVAYLVWQRDKHRERAAFYCAQSHNPPAEREEQLECLQSESLCCQSEPCTAQAPIEEIRITSDFFGTYAEAPTDEIKAGA